MFIPKVLGGGKEAKRLIATSEALADWTRRLADLISSGAAGSTRDALRRSLNSVPEPIAPAVTNLVTRMGPQGTETALRQFAREIDDPAAEKIAMVLILRERNGGPGLAEVLTALATDLDDRSRMVREVEAERAKPRSNMRTIVVVTLVLVVGMTLFARTFLSGYSTPFGQIALLAVVAIFATSLRWMRRLSDPVKPRGCSSTRTRLWCTGDRAADGHSRRDAHRGRPRPRGPCTASGAAVTGGRTGAVGGRADRANGAGGDDVHPRPVGLAAGAGGAGVGRASGRLGRRLGDHWLDPRSARGPQADPGARRLARSVAVRPGVRAARRSGALRAARCGRAGDRRRRVVPALGRGP
ncbi:type II secretion system F family protein [Blastococcus brunescens]|uniref:Type II secretion system F family protein n=1 Tax=Blastococcus brunescens TaxID=1564165 RepID=A0ABZ1B497_9ACTN|nr:type II secretion system F family protein [Blastococcus sp. BMG 8361]WRL65622.1 type II secretion system F family protein [Blastococcus sp. BMG 8361]